MKRLFPSSRTRLLAVTFMLVGGWSVVGFSFQETGDYEAGLKALQDGRYSEAVGFFEKAVAARPAPGVGYYPFFHLGKAYRCLENQEEAKAMFEQSFVSDELGKEPRLIAALDLQLSGNPPSCGEIPQMAPPAPPTTSARVVQLLSTTTAPATTSARVVQLQPTTTAAPTTSTPPVSIPVTPTTTVPSVTTTSAGPLPPLELILEEVRRLTAGGQIRQAWDRLEEAERGYPANVEIADLRDLVVESARQAARDAVVSQLQGHYDRAILGLEDAVAALSDRGTAHLYLAWACYAKYLVMGEKESTLVEKARREIGAALRIQPDLEADPRLVSPRFIDLLDEVRDQVR